MLDEVSALGLQDAAIVNAAVEGNADLSVALKICLWSRLGNRVLLFLSKFHAEDATALHQSMLDFNWDSHMSYQNSIAIDFSGRGCGIDNTHFGALKVKDAIVDFFAHKGQPRPSVSKVKPDLRFFVHARHKNASLYLDLSGQSLHRRGYRQQQGAAPLKENLAAAILSRANWQQLLTADYALIDPMCGVATLLIEGAMMAANMAPNLKRQYWGFSAWRKFDPQLWQQLLDAAQQSIVKQPLWIRGYEADPRLIQPARNNIARAGLSEWIKVYQGEIADFAPKPDKQQPALVVANPPYGNRLGNEQQLLYLYQSLGQKLRQYCRDWQAAIFTGNIELTKRMGLRSHKQYVLYNGAKKCHLVLLDIQPQQFVTQKPAPQEAQTLVPTAVKLSKNGEMFANRLRKNYRHLAKWARQNNISCYRLYDKDMPEFAVAVDIYQDWLVVQEYVAPKTVAATKAAARLLDVMAALNVVLGELKQQDPAKIVLKKRRRQSGRNQYQKHDSQQHFVEVSEGNVQLLVNFHDYLDTGLFLDHRKMRLRIGQAAKGVHFLNLYCYTATASVHAAMGKALTTTSVDLSKTYLDWAQKNMALNGLSEKNKLIQQDVISWLKQDKNKYQLIFVDPPTFSNSKSTRHDFEVQRDHLMLLKLAMARLTEDGVLYFSNNFQRFELDKSLAEKYHVVNISAQTIDEDFKRNHKIHQCWQLEHRR